MPVLGITGGAACGKSSFATLLADFFPGCVLFNADQEVRRLTHCDPEVRFEIKKLYPEAYTANGVYDREKVREKVFQSPELRQKLNSILHPRVRNAWSRLAEHSKNKESWLLVEIPLLFETGGEALCDRVVTVGCTAQTQLYRLTVLRGISAVVAEQIRNAQSSLEEKIDRSDHLIWNDCPFTCLRRQSARCAAWLQHYFA